MAIEIDPQAVNQLVADAVLKSALGEAVKKAVNDAVTKLSASWDNPLEAVVRNHIAEITREVMQSEHSENIRARVMQSLATKLSDDFINRVCEAAASKYN